MDPDQSLPALVSRDFDLVLGEEYPGLPLPPQPGVELIDLMRDPINVVRPAVLAAAAPRLRSLRELADQPWVMEPIGTPPGQWAVTTCRAAGFEPDVRYVSPDPSLHLRLVETGHAVALVPDLQRRQGSSADVQALPGGPARRIFTAVRRGAGAHPAVVALRTALDAAVRRPIDAPP